MVVIGSRDRRQDAGRHRHSHTDGVGRLIAGLARYTGDVGLAEDLAQDALVAALEQWPQTGVPRNAGAWLMAVAKRRAVDLFRRNRELERKYAQLAATLGRGRASRPTSTRPSTTTSTTTCCA